MKHKLTIAHTLLIALFVIAFIVGSAGLTLLLFRKDTLFALGLALSLIGYLSFAVIGAIDCFKYVDKTTFYKSTDRDNVDIVRFVYDWHYATTRGY